MKPVYIVDGLRTPMARAGTILSSMTAQALGQAVLTNLLLSYQLDHIDEVIFGCVGQPPEAMNIARVITLLSEIDRSVPAYTVHRNCASGMQAITDAAEKIHTGRGGTYIAGGVESMSNIPLFYPKRFGEKLFKLSKSKNVMDKLKALAAFRFRDLKPIVGIEIGLTDFACGLNMGITAENLAKDFGITREEQDAFALSSHQKAEAGEKNRAEEIITLYPPKKYEPLDSDNGVRKGQTLEALGKLKPYFNRTSGTVTVGNACQVTDGACALIVMNEERLRELNVEPLGRLTGYAYAGLDASRMGLGPAYAMPLALKKAGYRLDDMELIEINEAFASQIIACRRSLASAVFAEKHFGESRAFGEIPDEIFNVNGGGIALGHPVGMTGARLVMTLLKEMKRRNLHKGIASLCIGGGQGAALVLERD